MVKERRVGHVGFLSHVQDSANPALPHCWACPTRVWSKWHGCWGVQGLKGLKALQKGGQGIQPGQARKGFTSVVEGEGKGGSQPSQTPVGSGLLFSTLIPHSPPQRFLPFWSLMGALRVRGR